MKNVLLATSALVMFAGAASAEIALSGSARMGVVYDETEGSSGETFFSSRVRIVFTASGETDGGLAFGASVRADQTGGNNSDFGCEGVFVDADLDGVVDPGELSNSCADEDGDSNGDSTVFLSGAFGTLTMGDVSGAADALVGQVSGVGYGPIDGLQEIDFIGTDKTAVYYEYSAGALTFGMGVGQTYDVDDDVDLNDTANIGVKYSADGYSIALGYETSDSVDAVHLGASATFGAATVKARITDTDANSDLLYALSLDYVAGATTITGFYTDFGDTEVQHIGLGAAYDLGGGATLAGGIVMQDNPAGDDPMFADLGLKFKF